MYGIVDKKSLKKAAVVEYPPDTTRDRMKRNMDYITEKTGLVVNYVFEEHIETAKTELYSKDMIDAAIHNSIERYQFNATMFWQHLEEERKK